MKTTEIYDLKTEKWSISAILSLARCDHTASLLQNGKVLVAGGFTLNGSSLSSAELFDPSTEKWTMTGSMNQPRQSHTTTVLTNGQVLITGGYGSELYYPFTQLWTTY